MLDRSLDSSQHLGRKRFCWTTETRARKCEDPTEDHQWVICDGPVDALWIENMNTVLDDNKMLCLANSERIKLTNYVHMLFEVQDLAVASPATVSRCGMVYVDPEELGWMPYVQTWITSIEGKLTLPVRDYLLKLFEQYVNPCLKYVMRDCTPIIPQVSEVVGRFEKLSYLPLMNAGNSC
ncbi:Dynein heavy chain [Fasciola hepatica]|uniref:Dynein heavy chain n=1 Tax=Fasciola hepatica TaxID=6192 RepID=A0A4E0QW98_FASHE|nr:Dynein heavy chain [Fasciola hepatica]